MAPGQMSLLRGRRYSRAKKANGVRGPQKLDQNDPASTAERLAREHGVSAPTIKRDGKFAEGFFPLTSRTRTGRMSDVGTLPAPLSYTSGYNLGHELARQPRWSLRRPYTTGGGGLFMELVMNKPRGERIESIVESIARLKRMSAFLAPPPAAAAEPPQPGKPRTLADVNAEASERKSAKRQWAARFTGLIPLFELLEAEYDIEGRSGAVHAILDSVLTSRPETIEELMQIVIYEGMDGMTVQLFAQTSALVAAAEELDEEIGINVPADARPEKVKEVVAALTALISLATDRIAYAREQIVQIPESMRSPSQAAPAAGELYDDREVHRD